MSTTFYFITRKPCMLVFVKLVAIVLPYTKSSVMSILGHIEDLYSLAALHSGLKKMTGIPQQYPILAFVCDNPSCVSIQVKKAVKRQSIVIAMAISLSGLVTLLFDAIFPQFDPQVSQSNTDKFKMIAASFFSANED
ncbi:hypothetical protein BCV72DRAFT_27490 [Rhizopus microsporus var. microsporus]|nr:hypothetical protein BCV72DRAFT_27490 [Rhizopus microsporus var. microsporus]